MSNEATYCDSKCDECKSKPSKCLSNNYFTVPKNLTGYTFLATVGLLSLTGLVTVVKCVLKLMPYKR